MVVVQITTILLQHLLYIDNNILDAMVARHRPTMRLIFFGIRMPELADLGSEVDSWWARRIFRFLFLLDSVDATDRLYDTLVSPRSY